ncbi:hypothetical protein I9W82_000199 [Candida metapsilosis]|uniref:Uncharacterized protein n=1 Tax=Candida metapsilosis TaxID=273372 RepID=A0A8H7ZJ24_9ASCO|nr:hypothetical protein I9W82_000199 [Candida metapsilosis]
MQLLDLPIQLLFKAIQLKEHLLTFPEDVVLLCLNLLSQIDQFELLVEVAYGDRAYKIANRLAPVNQTCLRIYELFGYWATVRAMWTGDEYRHHAATCEPKSQFWNFGYHSGTRDDEMSSG